MFALKGGKKRTSHRRTGKKPSHTRSAGKKGSRRNGRKARRTHRRQRGGMFGSLTAVAKTALVPFGLLAAQKMLQRSRKAHK